MSSIFVQSVIDTWHIVPRILIIMFVSLYASQAGTALAKENIVKQDSGDDGKIDQITHFDGAEKISKQEVDSNGDGAYDVMTRYKDKKPLREVINGFLKKSLL